MVARKRKGQWKGHTHLALDEVVVVVCPVASWMDLRPRTLAPWGILATFPLVAASLRNPIQQQLPL